MYATTRNCASRTINSSTSLPPSHHQVAAHHPCGETWHANLPANKLRQPAAEQIMSVNVVIITSASMPTASLPAILVQNAYPAVSLPGQPAAGAQALQKWALAALPQHCSPVGASYHHHDSNHDCSLMWHPSRKPPIDVQGPGRPGQRKVEAQGGSTPQSEQMPAQARFGNPS